MGRVADIVQRLIRRYRRRVLRLPGKQEIRVRVPIVALLLLFGCVSEDRVRPLEIQYAETKVESAKGKLQQEKASLKYLVELFKNQQNCVDVLSGRVLVESENNIEQAKLKVKEAEIGIKQAEIELEMIKIRGIQK